MEIIKIAMFGICGVLLAVILKNSGSQIYVVISMAVSIIIMLYVAAKLAGIITQISYIKKYITVGEEYIGLLIKIIGITYITQFASDICRDNGYSVIAGQIEMFCRIAVAALSMPLVLVLFETVAKCMG